MHSIPLSATPSKQLIIKKNWDVILNRAKYYYKNDKERLREQVRDRYRNLSEVEKNEKQKHGINRYHNMSEEKKQRLKEHQKSYSEVKTLTKKSYILKKIVSSKALFIKTKNLSILTK